MRKPASRDFRKFTTSVWDFMVIGLIPSSCPRKGDFVGVNKTLLPPMALVGTHIWLWLPSLIQNKFHPWQKPGIAGLGEAEGRNPMDRLLLPLPSEQQPRLPPHKSATNGATLLLLTSDSEKERNSQLTKKISLWGLWNRNPSDHESSYHTIIISHHPWEFSTMKSKHHKQNERSIICI